MAGAQEAARRRQRIDAKILMGRHSRSAGPSRDRSTLRTTHCRSTGRSTMGHEPMSGALPAIDAMLEPTVASNLADAPLMTVVARLEARVQELEAQLKDNKVAR